MARKVKSVSFNLNDPHESEMYEYCKKFSNFSSFIKRLIQNSLHSQSGNTQSIVSIPKVEKVVLEQPVINQEYLKQLI